MAGYRITRQMTPHPVVYVYADASKALRKVRSLVRAYADFEIVDAQTDEPVSIEELELSASPPHHQSC